MHSCVTTPHDKEGAVYSGLLYGEGDSRMTQFELLTHTCIIVGKCTVCLYNNVHLYLFTLEKGYGITK